MNEKDLILREEKPLFEFPFLVWLGIAFISLCLGLSLLIFPWYIVLLLFLGACLAISIFFNLFIGLIIFLIGAYLHPTGQFAVLQAFNLARNLAFGILFIYLFHTLVYRDFSIVKSTQNFLLLGYIFMMFCSVFKHFDISFPPFLEFASKVVILYFAVTNFVKTPKHCLIIVWLLVVLAVISSSAAVFQFAHKIGLPGTGGIVRAYGITHNPNVLATELMIVVSVIISLFVTYQSKAVKGISLVFLVIVILGIIFTYSRAGFLGLCLVVFLSFWRFYLRNHKSFVVLAFSTMILFVAILAIIPFIPQDYWARVETVSDTTEISIRSRLDAYAIGLGIMLDHPIIGSGYEFFKYEFWDRIHTSAVVETKSPLLHAHNMFINTGAEIGIFGLLFLSLLIFYSWRDLRKAQALFLKANNTLFSNLAQSLEISLIGFIVLNLFSSHTYLMIFWILIAMSVVFKKIALLQVQKNGT